MLNRLSDARRTIARSLALFSVIWLAACEMAPVSTGGSGPRINTSRPVTVALLVPGGSQIETDAFLAANLENAARLAVADVQNANIDLRVYNTAGDPQQASIVATQAVKDGAKIILGPLYGEAAIAAGVAVGPTGVNVLAFSNNPTIAGGNVFLLGPTFENTASRLVRHAIGQGNVRIATIHGDTFAGEIGSDAVSNAAIANGAQVTHIASYPLSQQGIASSVNSIVENVKQSGATATFLTGTPAGEGADLPFILPALNAAGLSPTNQQFFGLTQWSSNPQVVSLVGAQGSLFTLPDTRPTAEFEARYTAAYSETPHPLAGLAYDGIAAIGALIASGRSDALTIEAITTSQGFRGTKGIFRFLPSGLNERALAIATIQNNQVIIVDPAPTSFGSAGL